MCGGGIAECLTVPGLALQDTDKVALLVSSLYFMG